MAIYYELIIVIAPEEYAVLDTFTNMDDALKEFEEYSQSQSCQLWKLDSDDVSYCDVVCLKQTYNCDSLEDYFYLQ